MSKVLTLSSVALLFLAAAGVAKADVGVRIDRTSARPGDVVHARSSASTLSLYLAPVATAPLPSSCRGGTAICTPTSLGPPQRPGWTWLGRFFPSRPSFHFRVPSVEPGLYRAVVYCAPCTRGPRGSLIAGAQVLRVR